MNRDLIDEIVKKVREELDSTDNKIRLEVSARHIHLTREHVDILFGKDYQLTNRVDLSQPGQFLCEERLKLVGPKGIIENVGIIGPERKRTQVEVSLADARVLGISPPIRDSGDTVGSEDIFLVSGKNLVRAEESTIVAKRHIHMRPEDARRFGVEDGDIVQVRVGGERSTIFDDVLIRVNKDYSLSMHIDIDESNAINYNPDMKAEILV